jgi:hypothetical protein
MAGPIVCETWWAKILVSFERQHDDLIASHPNFKEEIGLIHSALITIGRLVHVSPSENGNGVVWRDLTTRTEAKRTVLWNSKVLFTGMLLLYAAIHQEMNKTLQPEQMESPKEFCEQKRRKQNPSDEQANLPNKMAVMSSSVHDPCT